MKLSVGQLRNVIFKQLCEASKKRVKVEFVCPTQSLAQLIARELDDIAPDVSWNTGLGGYVVTATVPGTYTMPQQWADEFVVMRKAQS